MKIGYPCLNHSLECKGNRTFRLHSYSEDKIKQTIKNNLDCLFCILKFNLNNDILFFRISSDIIPFASHPICTFPWQNYFSNHLKEIGRFIINNDIRISMHPDQFIVINSLREDVIKRSLTEIIYHNEILDLMGLDSTAKIQIHVGGVYGDKSNSIKRFIDNYKSLDSSIKNRLVIENDDKSYCIDDCIGIFQRINIPVLFDYFHHSLYNNHESLHKIFESCRKTWKEKDGFLMVDYSSQNPMKPRGSHADKLDHSNFIDFIKLSKSYDFDIMLEIKNKEQSAMEAIKLLNSDKRLFTKS